MGKLYKLSDTSLPYVHISQDNFQQLQQRAQIWVDSLSSTSPLFEILKSNINENLEESRIKNAQHAVLNPLQFDIKVLRGVVETIENNQQFRLLNEFKSSAETIFSGYAEQANVLAAITRNTSGNFSNFVENFIDQSSRVVKAFNFDKSSSILQAVNSLDTMLQGFNLNQSTLNKIGDSLLQQTFSIVNKNFNFNVSFDSKKFTLDPSLAVLGQGITLFTNFLGIKDPNTARQINEVGQGVVSLGQTLLNVGAIAALSGPAAPFVAVGGALIGLFSSLFGDNGPSKEEQMLEAVGRQIQQLAEFIDKKFTELADHIDKRIGQLAKHLDKRFDRLEGILNNFYKDIMKQFFLVRQDISYLDVCIKQVNKKVENLQLQIANGFLEIYKQPYDKLITALEYHIRHPYPQHELTPEKRQEYYAKFVQWATINAKNELVAGKAGNGIDATFLCEEVIDHGINRNINTIVGYAVENFGIKDPGTLINPDIWGKAARDLLTFIARTPELEVLPTYQKDIEDIINAGIEYNQFKVNLKFNYKKLFMNLVVNYGEKLTAVCNIIIQDVTVSLTKSRDVSPGFRAQNLDKFNIHITYDSNNRLQNVGYGSVGRNPITKEKFWQNIIGSKQFDLALTDLERAYQLLVIYIATAFHEDYQTNSWLRETLAHLPVEKHVFYDAFENFHNYLLYPSSNPLYNYLRNIQSIIEGRLSLSLEIDPSEPYFITPKQYADKIIFVLAKILVNAKPIHEGDENVENIIQELELFKQSYFTQNPLQQKKSKKLTQSSIGYSDNNANHPDQQQIYATSRAVLPINEEELSQYRNELLVVQSFKETQDDPHSYVYFYPNKWDEPLFPSDLAFKLNAILQKLIIPLNKTSEPPEVEVGIGVGRAEEEGEEDETIENLETKTITAVFVSFLNGKKHSAFLANLIKLGFEVVTEKELFEIWQESASQETFFSSLQQSQEENISFKTKTEKISPYRQQTVFKSTETQKDKKYKYSKQLAKLMLRAYIESLPQDFKRISFDDRDSAKSFQKELLRIGIKRPMKPLPADKTKSGKEQHAISLNSDEYWRLQQSIKLPKEEQNFSRENTFR